MYLKATISHHLQLVHRPGAGCKHRFRDPMGFLSLRILFPILAMGLCILHDLRHGSSR